ncbi:hypothetical protein DRQ32_03875 [bacterium]|nr:MAG: hypothetical protein DRQ32_03875 [bacterium]
MKKSLLILALAGMVAIAGPAAAQQWFDFNGQALVPSVINDDLSAFLLVNNDGVIATPIPLDFDNFEYTLVVEGLNLDADGGSGVGQSYSGGTITLYEDDQTAADFTSTPTFTDGTAILSGTFQSLNRRMLTSTLGNATGAVDWTGGTRLAEIAPEDQTDWTFVVSISNRSTVTEPGYDENWNGKVEPVEPVVPNEDSSMSELKSRHQ